MKRFVASIIAILVGVIVGYFLSYRTPFHAALHLPGNKVIGFLPYWLSDKAQKDYSSYLSEIAYFSLTLDGDGNIQKLSNPQEEEPGWYALESGAMNPFLTTAKKNNQSLSLTIFSGDNKTIGELISDPKHHADTLVNAIEPVITQYNFSDINLDIEYIDVASDEARSHFTQFVQEVRQDLNKKEDTTLSLDISPTAFVKKYLVDPLSVSKSINSMIIMGYDYHYQGSSVTGPVAPLFGAGDSSEFDIETALKKAIAIMPAQKIVLGVPLYGYEWESIDGTPRSAVIPGTGLTASSARVAKLLDTCATCSAQFDPIAKEKYIIYKDTSTNSYHQIFYPDKDTMEEKIRLAEKYNLAGIALWALGYEDSTILTPLKNY